MKMNTQDLKGFVDKLLCTRSLDKYEEEYLYEAAQKGEKQLMEAMHLTYGMLRNDVIRETAQGCWELMIVIEQLMETAGPRCGENEWNNNREGLIECLRACECAMELARRCAPEEREEIAICVDGCRRIERKNRMRLLI